MVLSQTGHKGRLVFLFAGIFIVILTFGTYSTYSKRVRLEIPGLRYGTHVDRPKADAVKEAFVHAFRGYWAACKGQDEIRPVTNKCKNTRYVPIRFP